MIRVAQVGLGPIGISVVRQIHERPGMELVAAVDVDPSKAGQDVNDVCAIGNGASGIRVEAELNAAGVARADVAVVCTSSSLKTFAPLAESLLGLRLPVVSTTEELSYPFVAHPELAAQIDRAARRADVAVLGTGVNPGFVMDTLAMVMTAPCKQVDRISIDRFQNAATRRVPFQQKIGAGMEVEEFRSRVAEGRMGHIGFSESVAMIAAALGWDLERITDEVEPRIADNETICEAATILPGQVAGIVQRGTGYLNGQEVIRLHMEAWVGAPDSYDSVHVEGEPEMRCRIDGGVPGDIATASLTVNSIPKVLAAPPGLRTMADLPPPSWWAGG